MLADTAQKLLSPKAELIYLVKGSDYGRKAWYYILVDEDKVSTFLNDINDHTVYLEKYGEILFSAYGEEPPKEITDQLIEEYKL